MTMERNGKFSNTFSILPQNQFGTRCSKLGKKQVKITTATSP